MTEQPIIVLDAANIGWTAGNSKICSGKGLIEVINYCRNHGLKPVAFLPNNYLYSPKRPKRLITELEDVKAEQNNGSIIAVPPKDDDDLYMITYAQNKGAKLVSNDLFRDYISSSEYSAAESWVKDHVISYSFVIGEFFPNPKFVKFFENPVSEITHADAPKELVEKSATSQLSEAHEKSLLELESNLEALVKSIKPVIPAEPVEAPVIHAVPKIPTESAKILDEISSIDDSEVVEKALGFRYYCHVCGSGFKKWGEANAHKKESGHGAYICGECQEILPSPKNAKEHQEETSHDTFTGSWIGQHEMRVKSIPDLTIELINSSNNPPDEFLRQIVLNKGVEDKEYLIWRFTVGSGSGRSTRWPTHPKIAAQIIHEFEAFRGRDISWKECKNELMNRLSLPGKRVNGPLRLLQSLFQPDWSEGESEKPVGSWRETIIWDSVNIDGAIFEKILRSVGDYRWSDGAEKPDGWIEEINDYLEDVKIYYARLG